MKMWVRATLLFLSVVACKSSTQGEGVGAPPIVSSGTAGGTVSISTTADSGVGPASAPAACESATACDACLGIEGCNWTGGVCARACLADTYCHGPGNPHAPRCPAADASVVADASAPAPPIVGVHSLTFREGAHPPVGANGAHGATVWAVTLAASAGPSPELTALFQQAMAAHLAASVGEANCTPAVAGAYPSTMPTGDEAQILTVTFRSERDARLFAAALTETPLRVGRVRVGCAD